jgi:PEP-CTERM motif-containing protein
MFDTRSVKYLRVAVLLCSTEVMAGPIHSHCLTRPYAIGFFTTNPSLPHAYPGVENFFSFSVPLNANPPQSSIINCRYEISDINKIDVTFTFEGNSMKWNSVIINELLNPTGVRTLDFDNSSTTGATEFKNNIPFSYRYTSHQDDASNLRNLIEIHFPSGGLTYNLNAEIGEFTITDATIRVSGTHYYLGVPEPGTLALLSTGISLVLFCRNRRTKRTTLLRRQFDHHPRRDDGRQP